MTACLNRIVMNIIKSKCIGNDNLYFLGVTDSYELYDKLCHNDNKLNQEEYSFIKTWSNKKPRQKKDV